MFQGAITAIVTPFDDKGNIDEKALRKLVSFQIENNISGIVPCGTTGESPTLTYEEHNQVIDIVVDEARGRVLVIAGTGSNSTDEAILLTEHALKAGAHSSLQVSPYYNKPTQKGLYEHFIAIAEAVDLPMIIYNIPGRTGINIETDTLLKMAEHKNIVGVKEASGSISQMMDVLSRRPSGLGRDEPVVLDVCVACQFLWFDAEELEQLGQALPPPKQEQKKELTPQAREAMAMMALRQEQASLAAEEVRRGPEHFWQWLPALLGMPVEVEAPPVRRTPLLTWGLSLAMAVLFLWLLGAGRLDEAIRRWGFLPARWSREGGLTLLTSFFLHAGLLHLLSNLYFFVVFGDNVEDSMGRLGFVSLLGCAHLVGMLVHAAYDPRGDIPCVGASAGISGVIAYYALLYPRARLAFLFWVPAFRFVVPLGWLRIRAIWALALYVLLQAVGAWQQIGGLSHVSALAHLGGLAVGVAVGGAARIAQRRQSPGLS